MSLSLLRQALATLLLLSALFGMPGEGRAATGSPTFVTTEADDYTLGQQYVEMMRARAPLAKDPQVVETVLRLAREVVAASDRPDLVYDVLVLERADPNAMALPGGFMVIHTGILKVMTEDEVRFVLGHELAHVQLRHFATTHNMERAMQELRLGAPAAGNGTGAGGDPEPQWQRSMALQRSHSRQLEYEADLYGMLYAVRAGGALASGPSAMGKLRDLVGEIPPELARNLNHPSFADRIAQMEKGGVVLREHWRQFGEGVSLARAGRCDNAVASFSRFLKAFPLSASAWTNLGLCHLDLAVRSAPRTDLREELYDDLPYYDEPDVVVRSMDPSHTGSAERALHEALLRDPNRGTAALALACLYRRAGRLAEAKSAIEAALKLLPKHPGAQGSLGNLLAVEGNWKDALAAFKKADSLAETTLPWIARNRAILFELRGDKSKAIAQWKEVLKHEEHRPSAERHLASLGVEPKADASPTPASAPGEGEVVSLEGPSGVTETTLCGVSLGQTGEEIQKILGKPTEIMEISGAGAVLWMYSPLPLQALLVDGRVLTLSTSSPGRGGTGQGLRLGESEARAKEVYGPPTGAGSDWGGGLTHLRWDSLGLGVLLQSLSPESPPRIIQMELVEEE